jgi:diguanylate cyclase (GGDEF)-like protein
MKNDLPQAALDALPAYVAVVDASGSIVWVNRTWEEFAERYRAGDSQPAAASSYLLVRDVVAGPPADEAAAAAEGIRALLDGTCADFALNYPAHTADDERWFRLMARPLGTTPRDGAVIMQIDVTERMRLDQQLRDMRLHDSLTGLPSRVLLNDRFEQALLNSSRSNGRLAVLYLDLDGFEEVTERLGPEAGDDLLIEVSRRLRPLLRAGDTASRYGGDEFVILLLDIRSAEEAVGVAGRIARAFDPLFALPQGQAAIRASIGVAVEWSHLHTANALLEAAEHALRQAKREPLTRVVLFDGDADP